MSAPRHPKLRQENIFNCHPQSQSND